MKRFGPVAAVFLVIGSAGAMSAEKMLSEGKYFALRRVDDLGGDTGVMGTFAYRTRGETTFLPNEWVSVAGYPCKEILQKGTARAAREIFDDIRFDITADTGATNAQLRTDAYSAARALKSYCLVPTS